MADKKTQTMPGMGNMPGMNMGNQSNTSRMPGIGDPNQAANNSDPTKNQQGMDTPAPPVQASSPFMEEGMKNMPMATPKQVWTVTGTENWDMLRGFGPAAGMIAMMNGMMVGGGPMQSMKMGKMDMSMAEMPAPTPEQARTAADTSAPAPVDTSTTMTQAAPMPVAAPTPQAPPTTAPVTIASVTAAILPNPPKAGINNTLTLTVTGSDGKPLSGATVTTTVAMTTMDMGTTHPAFRDIGGGKYQGSVVFGMAGPWRVSLHVAVPGQRPSVKDIVFVAK